MKNLTLTKQGDYFEAYGQDAVTIAKALGLTLTRINNAPNVGIPYHSIHRMVEELKSLGYTVTLN
jgi:DNA mismatch repair ATPase MutS